jgi:hypothetical protein
MDVHVMEALLRATILPEYGVDIWVIIPFCFSTSTVVYLLHYSHDYQLTNTLLIHTQFSILEYRECGSF